MAELIVTGFQDWTAVDLRRRRRLYAAPGVALWLDQELVVLPELETCRDEAGLRVTALARCHQLRVELTPPGRPVSWCWLRLGGSAELCGRRLTYRAAVFDGHGRWPSRLVLDLQ